MIHHDTEPQVLVKDVTVPGGQRISRGTVIYVLDGHPTLATIGVDNLGPLSDSAIPRKGATN
jgi:hypothetical protein